MTQHERIVDHLVIIVSESEQKEIGDRLQRAGFPRGNIVMEENFDLKSHLLPMAGGGFVELSMTRTAGKSPMPGLMNKNPRALGVAYTTMDAAAELAAWNTLGVKDAFAAAGNWKREDGSTGFWMGVSPAKIGGEPYFVLQERRVFPLPYPEHANTAPRLKKIVTSGPDAEVWRQRHIDWFGFKPRNGSLHAGDTELVFRKEAQSGLTLVFDVPGEKGTIPLVQSAIELE